ncbi:hypothetical protein EV217_5338 [Phyllobacterium myrsinacearum]|uniref:TM2 domain-containing protein n=1 Tax=Phyllobacterium myrsinacearum TaxID=28101 RepID=UPI00102A1E79|nr:TM2 domain-containing protein [Phyllobacterium myrsinacearum]RZS70636.1 hypothetical protein EV217_5338 [Phyllobacterium myrsinacearum]
MKLSETDVAEIEQRVVIQAKTLQKSYFYWLFLGPLGGHHFYLYKPISGLLLLALTVVGLTFHQVWGVWSVLAIVPVWLVADAFRIPTYLRRNTNDLRFRLKAGILAERQRYQLSTGKRAEEEQANQGTW